MNALHLPSGSLPAFLTSLIGREEEVSILVTLLDKPRCASSR